MPRSALSIEIYDRGCMNKVIPFPNRRKAYRIDSLYGCITVTGKEENRQHKYRGFFWDLKCFVGAGFMIIYIWSKNVLSKAKGN